MNCLRRNIVQIDEEKCNGCGACADACHEGAIEMHNGKARLIRDDYCDGLGDCLPACPTGAISIIERESRAYDEQAVKARKRERMNNCPGIRPKTLSPSENKPDNAISRQGSSSRLSQWPVQIKLTPVNAPCFNEAKLLTAADCTAYAYASFQEAFIKGRVTLIGCPKLDAIDYSEKLTEIIRSNEIKSVLVVRMEVPCCGGLEYAVKNALQNSGKMIPWQVVTLSIDGKILDDGTGSQPCGRPGQEIHRLPA